MFIQQKLDSNKLKEDKKKYQKCLQKGNKMITKKIHNPNRVRPCRHCGQPCYGMICRECYSKNKNGSPSTIKVHQRYYNKHYKGGK